MHYEKFKGSVAVQKVLEHSDRGIDSSDTHKHSNESIDQSRTHLNYELKDRGGLTAYEYHRQRIEQITAETKERTGKGIRKDAVTLCSWVVTAPQDLPTEKHSDFFKGVYGWFAERYGEDNIVTAVVHKDEKTPHMHFQFTPIIENDGVRRLCAKEVENRKSLQTIHKKLQKHLASELGCEVNLLNGATENGNKTIQQMKNEELQAELQQVSNELGELQNNLEAVQNNLSEEVLKSVGAVKKIVEKLLHGERKLSEQEVEDIQRATANTMILNKELERLKAEWSIKNYDAERRNNELHEILSNSQKAIHTEAERLSKGSIQAEKRRADEAIEQANKERDRAIEQARKAVKQANDERDRAIRETEHVKDVCEFITSKPFEDCEAEYNEWLDIQKRQKQSKQKFKGR